MDDQSLARAAADLVRAGWDMPSRSAEPLGGGMNSATALVELSDGQAVLKWVPDSAAVALAEGCEVARRLARHGLVTGEPFPTTVGELTYPVGQGAAALLRFVSGEQLDPRDPQDQQDLAITLAAVHTSESTLQSGSFGCDQIAAMAYDVEPWIAPAIDRVLEEYHRLPALTWGLLHTDPAPEAFLRTNSGEVAVIDWTGAGRGPVLYDVASALMYLGGRQDAEPFWNAYVRYSPAPARELIEHLDAFTRFRGVVQAAYFSMRIATQDRTGIDHDDENWKGLRDAEQMLRAARGLQ